MMFFCTKCCIILTKVIVTITHCACYSVSRYHFCTLIIEFLNIMPTSTFELHMISYMSMELVLYFAPNRSESYILVSNIPGPKVSLLDRVIIFQSI